MNLRYIDEVLPANLKRPSLSVLKPIADRYEVMLFQPDGEITGRADFIGNSDQALAHRKHLAFFKLAKDKMAHLAMCPEYSCPWETITTLLNDSIVPAQDALWVIGCEAISPAAFAGIRSAHPAVTWIFDDLPASGARQFYDPVVYLFKTLSQAGEPAIVGLVQYKTQEMADRELFLERDHLIKGESIYVLRNEESSIYLLTIICSDALGFLASHLRNRLQPHMVLHIQLNPDPRYPAIREYRKGLFDSRSDNKEVVCLNWARGIRIRGKTDPLNEIAGSAIYTKAPARELDAADESVLINHNLGLYITNWKSSSGHAFFLNHAEAVFYFSTTRVSQADARPATARRTGPRMLDSFSWNASKSSWEEMRAANSGLEELCARFNLTELKRSATRDNPLDFERFLTLSCGLIQGAKWEPSLDSLLLFEIGEGEVVFRVSFCQDPHPDAERSRDRVLNLLTGLVGLVADRAHYPKTIIDLAEKCELRYFASGAPANLFPTGDGTPAFVAFIGNEGSPESRRALYEKMVSFCKTGDPSRGRVVLWYQEGLGFSKEYERTKDLAKDYSESPQSIVRDSNQ